MQNICIYSHIKTIMYTSYATLFIYFICFIYCHVTSYKLKYILNYVLGLYISIKSRRKLCKLKAYDVLLYLYTNYHAIPYPIATIYQYLEFPAP